MIRLRGGEKKRKTKQLPRNWKSKPVMKGSKFLSNGETGAIRSGHRELNNAKAVKQLLNLCWDDIGWVGRRLGKGRRQCLVDP